MFYELYLGVLKWSGIPKCYLRTFVIKKLKFMNSADILLGKALMTPQGTFSYETQWHFKCFSVFNHIEISTKWKPPWNGWISENFTCFWMSARFPCCLLLFNSFFLDTVILSSTNILLFPFILRLLTCRASRSTLFCEEIQKRKFFI